MLLVYGSYGAASNGCVVICITILYLLLSWTYMQRKKIEKPGCRFTARRLIYYIYQTLSNLFSFFASAEILHLDCSVKYACGHYQLHASGLLQLGEIEDVTTHSVFYQPAPVSQHWFEPVSAVCCSLEEISTLLAAEGSNKVPTTTACSTWLIRQAVFCEMK